MRPLALLSLILFSLAACSKQKTQDPAAPLVREIPSPSLAASLVSQKAASLTCADPAACPAAVGLLVGAGPSSVTTCTSFLVGEDLLVTNAHCLPSAVRHLPDLCDERVSVVFPGGASYRCAELMKASERPNVISPDLALLRLERKTGRAAFPLNGQGVEPNKMHSAYKIDPGPGASGVLVAQRCFTAPGSYRFPLYRGKESAAFVTGDCPSKAGNSGAPLVNDRGEAVGAFQAELALSDDQRAAWEPHLQEGESFSPLALGTSLRCLSEDCPVLDEEEIERPRISDFPSPPLPSSPSPLLRWETKKEERTLERKESLSPVCFDRPAAWIEGYRRPGTDEYEVDAALSLSIAKQSARIIFNRYMQVSAEFTRTDESERWRFSPQALVERARSPVDTGSLELDLPVCGDTP